MMKSYFDSEEVQGMRRIIHKKMSELEESNANCGHKNRVAWARMTWAMAALLVDLSGLFYGWTTVYADEYGDITIILMVAALLKAAQVAIIVFLIRDHLETMNEAERKRFLIKTIPLAMFVVAATGLIIGVSSMDAVTASVSGGAGNSVVNALGSINGGISADDLATMWAAFGPLIIGLVFLALSIATLVATARIAAWAIHDAGSKFQQVATIRQTYGWRKERTAQFVEKLAQYQSNWLADEATGDLQHEIRADLARLLVEYREGLFDAKKIGAFVQSGIPTDDPRFVYITVNGRRERVSTASIEAAAARIPACEQSADCEQTEAAIADFLCSQAITAIRWKEPVSCR